MLHEGKCSIPSSPIADGESQIAFRTHKFGEALQTRFWPDHSAPTSRRYNFHCSTGNVSIASTHVSPCTANTGTPIHGFWNPPNSGVQVHLLKHSVTTISGTPGGPFLWNHHINQTITAAPNVTPICALPGGAACKSLWFTSTAFTGCTIGTLFKHAWRMPAAASGWSEGPANELDDGDIIIPPGSCLGMFAYAAGTSHIVQSCVTFAEYPVV